KNLCPIFPLDRYYGNGGCIFPVWKVDITACGKPCGKCGQPVELGEIGCPPRPAAICISRCILATKIIFSRRPELGFPGSARLCFAGAPPYSPFPRRRFFSSIARRAAKRKRRGSRLSPVFCFPAAPAQGPDRS